MTRDVCQEAFKYTCLKIPKVPGKSGTKSKEVGSW